MDIDHPASPAFALDANQNKLLAALTIAAARELAGDTVRIISEDEVAAAKNDLRKLRKSFSPNARMARVQDIVLVDHAGNREAPRLICVYRVDLLDMGEGKKFKFEPSCMLYAYEWLHKAQPAEFRLVLMKDPAIWFEYATTRLLDGLDRARPHLFKDLNAA